MTLLIVLASVAAYLAVWYVTSLKLARRANESYYGDLDDFNRRFHLGIAMFTALGWPVVLPLLFVHTRMLGHVGPTSRELRIENERLQSEIDRLERKMGIS